MNNIRNMVGITCLGAVALGAFATLGGCATARPPQDLVTARSTFDRASHGPAATLAPADMHAAKEQLDSAEAAFKEDGDTQSTRDQAYVATRKTELAEAAARTLQMKRAQAGVVNTMHDDQTEAIAHTSAELNRTKTALNAQNVAFVAQGTALKDAEKRAAQAAADLARFATVKQEPRGMVITLSGSVLFTSAKSELSPGAQLKLNEVADALIKQDPVSKMVVEGHTDSQGGADYNEDLSQRRAQAVRDYLVTRGIASDRISAQGFGSTRPVADNNSAEGRANNRRVEIVVQSTPPAP
jgi:outer membrane protein OmpA-like peptidoglycan-associated protein